MIRTARFSKAALGEYFLVCFSIFQWLWLFCYFSKYCAYQFDRNWLLWQTPDSPCILGTLSPTCFPVTIISLKVSTARRDLWRQVCRRFLFSLCTTTDGGYVPCLTHPCTNRNYTPLTLHRGEPNWVTLTSRTSFLLLHDA